MNNFQQELQTLNLNDYHSGNVVYWDNQTPSPYYTPEDYVRRCGGCGGCGGRCGGCGGCARCFGCGGCARCFGCGGCWWGLWFI